MSDTPRTDAEAADGWSDDAICVSAEFAKSLERDIIKLQSHVAELGKLLGRVMAERDQLKSCEDELRKEIHILRTTCPAVYLQCVDDLLALPRRKKQDSLIKPNRP